MNIKRKNRILIICIGFLTLLTFSSCKNVSKPDGFVLQRFNVINPQLDSLIQSVEDSIEIKSNVNSLFIKPEVLVLLLRMYDSLPEFCFTGTVTANFSENYIYSNLTRIVGYIKSDKIPIIVLSTVSKQFEFENLFYNFLIPTKDRYRFHFIYFPDNLYEVNTNGEPIFSHHSNNIFQYYSYSKGKFNYMNYN